MADAKTQSTSKTISIYECKIISSNGEVIDLIKPDSFSLVNIQLYEDIYSPVIHGYATSTEPHNAMFDIRKKLPLFTKSSDSKSLYCAGYYCIKFDKGWVKSFCPKKITLERYPYNGPFKTELEMKQVLANVTK